MEEGRVDQRELNDPARLAEEARAQIEKYAAEIRAAKSPVETEPPTIYRP